MLLKFLTWVDSGLLFLLFFGCNARSEGRNSWHVNVLHLQARDLLALEDQRTTAAIQCYLDNLAKTDAPVAPLVRALLDRAVGRLHQLCATLLHRSYPRLTRPPLNMQSEEMLSLVVERLLKALREARPTTTRQFFSLAGQHIRWELNDLARRLDSQPGAEEFLEEMAPFAPPSDSGLSARSRHIFEVIDGLPEEEREAFDLVRIQGLSHVEAAELLEVSPKTVKRRLDRGLRLLTERLGDVVSSAAPQDST